MLLTFIKKALSIDQFNIYIRQKIDLLEKPKLICNNSMKIINNVNNNVITNSILNNNSNVNNQAVPIVVHFSETSNNFPN